MAEEFKPDATDGDGDGMVQDGTEWERPVEEAAVVPESVVEDVLETATISEAPEAEDVISAPKPVETKPALSPTKDGAIGSSAAESKPKAKKDTIEYTVFVRFGIQWEEEDAIAWADAAADAS